MEAPSKVNHPKWNQLIACIHASDWQAVVAVAGGGSGAISQLLTVPGASRTLLEAIVPYAQTALDGWLGGPMKQACCEQTARAMAMAAWSRGRQLAPDADPCRLVGLGGTASLATDRPKRGPHRIHVAAQTAKVTRSITLKLQKGKRDRSQEESLAASMMLVSLAETLGLDATEITSEIQAQLDEQLLEGEHFKRCEQHADTAWTELLLAQRHCVFISPDDLDTENQVQAPVMPKVVFPGAFNPPHDGHRKMARIAAEQLGHRVAWELSVTNVDKPPLDFVEIAARLRLFQQLSADHQIILTNTPTFREKAELFPSCHFVVGIDTIARIADPRYYNNDPIRRDAALDKLIDSGCRFLVFGRLVLSPREDASEGRFQTLDDMQLPEQLLALCEGVSEEDFRADISSTELRTSQ